MSGVLLSKMALATALAGFKEDFKDEFEEYNTNYDLSLHDVIKLYKKCLSFIHPSVDTVFLDEEDFAVLCPYLKEW